MNSGQLAAGLLAAVAGSVGCSAVRFAAQWGDGLFQAALGGAVLFNPERQADPLAVAAGLAVLLLPYSLVGPFAGALLDRWDRRRVLIVANLLRGVLHRRRWPSWSVAGVGGVPLYLGALAVTGVSRFVLAGLSAALPHVVARRHLVEATSSRRPAGAAMTALGAACAIGLRELLGLGRRRVGRVTTIAALGSLLGAAVVAAGFRPTAARPGRDATSPPQAVGRGGARAGRRRPGDGGGADRRGVVPRAGRAPARVRRSARCSRCCCSATRSPTRA